MIRILLSGDPQIERVHQWVRLRADGRVQDRGEAAFSHWPHDDEVTVVLPAAQARLVTLAMPPMSRERLERAVRLALDDALASEAGETAVAIAERGSGTVLVAAAARSLVDAIGERAPRARIVPEAALAPHAPDAWTWCRSANGGGFVRRSDGSAFPVGDAAPALPVELSMALAQAARGARSPRSVQCAFACDAAQRNAWSHGAGIAFDAAAPWSFADASPATLVSAPDLAQRGQRATVAAKAAGARAFRPALVLAALALAVHLGGLAWTWASVGLERARLARAVVAQASAIRLVDAATPASAAFAIASEHARRRHAAGQAAPADALPLLARAAPSLASLPPGTLRAARFGGEAWTLELGPIDKAALSRIARDLAAAGVDALAAPTAGGARVRLALAPTAR
jgi:type II secretion system protein L